MSDNISDKTTIITIHDTKHKRDMQVVVKLDGTLDEALESVAAVVKASKDEIKLYCSGKEIRGGDTVRSHMMRAVSTIILVYTTKQDLTILSTGDEDESRYLNLTNSVCPTTEAYKTIGLICN